MYSLTWDLPPKDQLAAYAQKAQNECVPMILKQPGIKEFRAYRNPQNMTPQVIALHEFEDYESAQQFSTSEAGARMLAEMRDIGCANFTVQIWDRSPLIPDPLRP